ncbi:MAG TPA: DUF2330 domain-containing protein [Thermoanaerobaculia bacterium]|nr:DUF2330 domain-containing protein [Thermoanaerobaculia bacterium]
MIRRVAALLIASIAATQPLFACAPAPHAGEEIEIVEESAIIHWDPATKTEQFIRRATFKGTAKDFGFLVPTPTTPTLEEVSDDVFAQLETKTARKTVEKTTKRIDWTPLVALLFLSRKLGDAETMTAGRAPVEVLSTQKIAGYEAAVLDATDAKALNEWLSKNGYATTPNLEQWLDAYIKQGWKITAYKIDKSQGEAAARTSAVKMTFQTERPFFPYREPKTERPYDSVRALTIFFQGPERVTGVIGEKEFWPGVMTWSDTKLTKFVDTSNVRPGFDDLFFTRDKDQSNYELPPIVHENVETTNLPADVIAIAAVIVILIIRRIRR